MSVLLIIVIAAVVIFIVYVAYNYRKMKNMQEVKTSKKIRILDKKNFGSQIRRGTIIVDFWASWCAPCKMMTPVLNDIAEKEGDKVRVGKVNVEHNQYLAKKFKIKKIPALIILQDGKEVGRVTGFKTKKALMKEINKVI